MADPYTSGIGTGPAGEFEAGAGEALTVTGPPTGAFGSRYIDAVTGDYAQDTATLQLQQMPPMRQRFLLALATKHGSSTVVRDLGVILPDKISIGTQREVEAAVRTATRHLTEVERVARVDAVRVELDPGNSARVVVTVAYTDLTTGEPDTFSVPTGRV